jgi:hypothetical protein
VHVSHQEWVVVFLKRCDGVDGTLHISLGGHLVSKLGALHGETHAATSAYGHDEQPHRCRPTCLHVNTRSLDDRVSAGQ